MSNVQVKRIALLSGGVLAAVAISAGMIFVANNADLIPSNRFNPDNFIQYGLSNVLVQSGDENVATGLASRTVDVTFDSNTSGPAQTKPLEAGGLHVLGNTISDAIEETPAIYNVNASTMAGAELKFAFQSVSPSDYLDDTYRNAYQGFTRIGSSSNYSSMNYTSTVDGRTGQRTVAVNATIENTSTGSMLKSLWATMVENLPAATNTTYQLNIKSGTTINVHGTFSTEDERQVLLNTDDVIWNNLSAYVSNRRGSVYNVAAADLFLSPVEGSNQTTIALSAPEGTDKGAFAADFREKAAADPEVAFVYAITTTLTVAGESTPFDIIYPSNRDW